MDLDGIAVFVKVVQEGSFSAAARRLAIPNTTVSAKVARLEKRLGVTLIQRTTRKLHVTPAGRAYFERCLRALEEIGAGEAEMTLSGEPRGLLRITAPGDVAHGLLPELIGRFLERYPQTRIELVVANRVLDLVAEGVHLGIRAAALRDSSLVARRFMTWTGGLWASPAYLAKHEAPRAPGELAGHQFIRFPRFSARELRLTDGRSRIDLPAHGRIAVDDLETVRNLALQGRGIAMLTDYLARGAQLVRVLPRWTWMGGALSFVYPGQPFVPANVRAFIDTALEARG